MNPGGQSSTRALLAHGDFYKAAHAHKDFDLLVIPGAGHGIGGTYGIRDCTGACGGSQACLH